MPKRLLSLICIKSAYRELTMRILIQSMMKLLQYKCVKQEARGCQGPPTTGPGLLMRLTAKMRIELILPISQSGTIYGPSKIFEHILCADLVFPLYQI